MFTMGYRGFDPWQGLSAPSFFVLPVYGRVYHGAGFQHVVSEVCRIFLEFQVI